MIEAFGKISNVQQVVTEFIDRVGAELLQKEVLELKSDLFHIDIIRDIAIPLNTQLMTDLFYFDLKTDENPDGKLGVAELYNALVNLRIWSTNITDPAESWNRRRRVGEGAKVVIDSARKLVDEVVAARGLGLGISAALSAKFSRQAYLEKGSLRSLGHKLVDTLLAQGSTAENVTDQLWLMAFGGIGVLVMTVSALVVKWAELMGLVPRDHGILSETRE